MALDLYVVQIDGVQGGGGARERGLVYAASIGRLQSQLMTCIITHKAQLCNKGQEAAMRNYALVVVSPPGRGHVTSSLLTVDRHDGTGGTGGRRFECFVSEVR